MPSIAAYTSICEEDAYWLEQYLAEAERLALPFAMNLDRCSLQTKRRVQNHILCIGTVEQNNPKIEFDETHKQRVFDLVVTGGFSWAMAWDVDETYERDAKRKLEEIVDLDADYIDIRWLNLWEDRYHIRVDPPFNAGHRIKFYKLGTYPWKFTGKVTNGAKHMRGREPRLAKYNLVCLHWGLMTKELRILHKDRWDRIYGKAVGKNPYGFWNMALDEENYPAVVAPNEYL